MAYGEKSPAVVAPPAASQIFNRSVPNRASLPCAKFFSEQKWCSNDLPPPILQEAAQKSVPIGRKSCNRCSTTPTIGFAMSRGSWRARRRSAANEHGESCRGRIGAYSLPGYCLPDMRRIFAATGSSSSILLQEHSAETSHIRVEVERMRAEDVCYLCGRWFCVRQATKLRRAKGGCKLSADPLLPLAFLPLMLCGHQGPHRRPPAPSALSTASRESSCASAACLCAPIPI